MYRSTDCCKKARRAFSLAEVIVASSVVAFVLLGAWSVYVMMVTWWHQTEPKIEAQRIARITLARVVSGIVASDAGTDQIGNLRYLRRNGIAWAVGTPSIPSENEIEFALAPDSSNVRAYYFGTDSGSGKGVLYYEYNGSTEMVKGTLGLTDLKFEFLDSTYKNLIRVTATVQKSVNIGNRAPYSIKVEYTEVVFLKNV